MPSELAALLEALKASGVKSFKGELGSHPVSIEFWPPKDHMVLASPAIEALPKLLEPEVCRCGHLTAEHTDGLCLMACDEEICLGTDNKEDAEA